MFFYYLRLPQTDLLIECFFIFQALSRTILYGNYIAENISPVYIFHNFFVENILKFEIIHLLLRDMNIKKAAKDMRLNKESCFVYTLQLVVLNSLKSIKFVTAVISISRNVFTHFDHLSLSREKLSFFQKDLYMSSTKIEQDVPIRWKSTYYLLEKFFK